MTKNNIRETKQRFTLRKNKKYKNLISVGIGLFIITSAGIIAQEEAKANEETPVITTTNNPATNNPEAQPKTTEEEIESREKENNKDGNIEIQTNKEEIDKEIEKAESSGINIEKEEDQNLGTAETIEEARNKQNQANEEYNRQKEEIKTTTEEYNRKKEEHNKEVNRITTENEEAQNEYEKNLTKYNTEKERIERENRETKENYDRQKEEVDRRNEEITRTNAENEEKKNRLKAQYERDLEEYNRLKRDYEKLKEGNNVEKKGNIYLIGDYNSAGISSLDYYKNFTVLIEDEVEKITTPIKWNNDTTVTVLSGTSIKKSNSNNSNYNYKNISLDDKYLIRNVATIEDGSKIHLRMTIKDLYLKSNAESYYTSEIWREKGVGISKGKNNEISIGIIAYSKIRFLLEFIDDNNSPVTIAATSVLTDIDWKQGLSANWNKSETIYKIPPLSNIGKFGASYHEISGSSYDDVNSIPRGSLLTAGYGSSLDITYYGNHPNDINRGVQGETPEDPGYFFTMFGNSFKGKTITNPKPTPPELPALEPQPTETIDPPVYKPLPEKPVEPTPTPLPEKPEAPTIRYHYVTYNTQPEIHKEVKNLAKENINKKLVPKLSTVNWELKTEELAVGREKIKNYKITDYLPKGYEINIEKTKELSTGYTLEYKEETNTITFIATKETLNKINKDRTTEITPLYPTISGKVLNDGATYENNFILEIEKTKENTGTVIVHYKDKQGNTIQSDVIDEREVEVGTTYNTTDNKPDEIGYNGAIYRITTEIEGEETGEVTEEDKEITYIYEKITQPENKGTVIIHYKDKQGNTIQNDVIDEREVEVGTTYNTTDNKSNEITKDNITYRITTEIEGEETGEVEDGVTEVTYIYDRVTQEKESPKKYKKYSNKVVVYTPGNDPKKPRPPFLTVPGEPENPTPHDNLIKPEKHNKNKDGVDINGTPMYVGAVNNYTLTWDLDQYKGIKASKEEIKKGFYYIEDYPEEALEIKEREISITDNNGEAVEGIKVEKYTSIEEADEETKAVLEKAKITPKGAFQIYTAINAQNFYDKYVTTGKTIKITAPMTVKENFTGEYKNKAYQIDFGNGYETEEVINNVPKVEPKKENTDKNGVNIDGKTLLPNSVNYYKLTWDLDQYKGIKASREEIEKGFYFIDDYPEEALETNENGITLVDSTGKAVTGVKVEVFESLEKATDEVKAILSSAKIKPKGAFQLFKAENPEQFYNDYVTKGLSIIITNPMVVKEAFVGEYENKAYQVDFGNGYETDLVVNNVPKLDPKKDVVIDLTHSNESLDGKTIEKNKVFNYHLIGSKLPANRGDEITQYVFYDDYDQKGDQYDGIYLAFTTIDITLKDGTIIKRGTEITKYTTQNVDTKDGKVSIEVDKEFLEKISLDSEFQVDVFLQIKRISSGTFKNTFINTVNGYKTTSNTVETNTSEPPKSTPKKPEPKPESKEPTPQTPKTLPKTSAVKIKKNSNDLGAVAGALAIGTLTLVKRRRVK